MPRLSPRRDLGRDSNTARFIREVLALEFLLHHAIRVAGYRVANVWNSPDPNPPGSSFVSHEEPGGSGQVVSE